jgi:hypothetical protein
MKITIEHLDETFTHEFPNEQCEERIVFETGEDEKVKEIKETIEP